MRIRRLISLLALPLALAACEGEAAAPEIPAGIAGSWNRAYEEATANMVDYLGFGGDGFYVRDVHIFETPARLTLLSTSREEGTYRLNGERLELRITRVTEWDAETGGSPVVTTLPGTWADAGTVRIVDENRMDRTYVTYPADAPEETTITYFRALPD